jgi:ABC-type bacteriocin/lantibiotic exporter with double-glycine peptidase domain
MNSVFYILKILPKNFRSKFFLIFVLLILTSVLEFIGISFVVPILAYFSNDVSNINTLFIFKYLPDLKKEDFLFTILFIFLFFFIMKNLFLLLLYYWQNKLTWSVYKNLSLELLNSYLKKPYSFFFSHNSSILINNVIHESKNISLFINKIIVISVEISILIGVGFFLLYFNTLITIFLGLVLIIFYSTFNILTKNKIYNLGQVRLDSSYNQLKGLQQIFSTIKEIKLKSIESVFINIFKININNFCNAAKIQGFFLELPKIFIEIVFIFCILLLTLFFNIFNYDNLNLISVLGLFAVAAFRTIPSVNRILNAKQTIKFLLPSLNNLKDDLNNEKNLENNDLSIGKASTNLSFEDSIIVSGVSYKYPDTNKDILANISFSIKKNEYIGIVGKSGSGKSTLLDLVMGLIIPDKGQILLDKVSINNNLVSWQKRIGYVPQSVVLIDDSIKNNITFGMGSKSNSHNQVIEVCKKAQIYDYINSLEKKFETNVGEKGIKLSGGQIQRLGIARTLFANPEVIIFDEATSSLDLKTEDEFLQGLELLRGKVTLIFVSHRKSSLKYCNKIIDLDEIKL